MMPPNGLLALTGLRAQSYYLRDLLERAGMSAELLQVGKFKGAADPLTRSDMAPEVRETMGALLDDPGVWDSKRASRSNALASKKRACGEGLQPDELSGSDRRWRRHCIGAPVWRHPFCV